ncbi:HEAT repeat-containing protein 1 [Tritrichomonas musculus]|uniref:HEAT repeat-containing protein 1 n=1 Tax=Tritrichomonas musculus TaxID=1915356 RepID=A0ABR2KQS6_9EUKA
MASALDKQLNEYRSRPKDESGARRTRVSLIYDPREASFVDADTIYQIGYQGFSKLCSNDDRFLDFGSSIFHYNNIQIDPIFLTLQENQSILEEVENLMYLLSEYIMTNEAVQVLEYLIRQFAVNKLRPAHLVITVLPYLETSFFVRVIQTIPFKDLPEEYKFLKEFRPILESKKPISRTILREMIERRSDLLHWIIKFAYPIAELHPNGSFVSFVGVLFTEIGLNTSKDVIIGSIIETCRSSFGFEDKSLAPHLIMAVAAINEKKQLHEKVINKFTELIISNSGILLKTHFRSILMATIYFLNLYKPNSNQDSKNKLFLTDFIIELGNHINELDEISKKYKMKVLAENAVEVISTNLYNDDLVRSSIAILETDFFVDVAYFFISEVCKHYLQTDFSESLIQSIAAHYPTILTTEIINQLSTFNIHISPSQVAPRNLSRQLTNPTIAGSLYSNPELPFDIASSNVLLSLASAKASENSQPIIPIIDYFSGRATEELLQYLCESLFIDESSKFSVALNAALSSKGNQIAPYFDSIPSTNNEILNYLVNYQTKSKLPDFHVLPLALARSIFTKDPVEALQFLPIRPNFDYSKLRNILHSNGENLISIQSDEEIAATILRIADKIIAENNQNENQNVESLKKSIGLLLNFPDICCVAPILKNIKNQSLIIAVFEETGPRILESADYQQRSLSTSAIMKKKRIRMNYLYYLYAQCQKIEDPLTILPSLYMALLTNDLVDEAILILRSIPLKNKDIKKTLTVILRQSQFFSQGEESLRNVFSNVVKNPKSREFFDILWNNIHTPIGCSQFWRLTLDIGVIPIIKKFVSDSEEIPIVLEKFLKLYPQNEDLMKWSIDSLRPALMRASIPFLPLSYIDTIVPVVCAYPKYFSSAFTQFFLGDDPNKPNREIDCNILIPFLKESSVKLIQKVGDDESFDTPPEKLKSLRLKTKYVISPATLILELIPLSNNLQNIVSIVPSLFTILKTYRLHHLVFPILNACAQESADYMIKNFNIIVDTLSHSPIPHIHSSALDLVRTLAKYDPSTVAKHTTSLFTALTGSTIFADDTANLLKIKQLLSSVLPILSKTDNIDQLTEYFAKNLDSFSFERASQLIVHSIEVLGDDSYKVFYSLLKEKRIDFSLLIVEQLKPKQLMTALINLLSLPKIQIDDDEANTANNDNDEIIAFILQITLPPLPEQLEELFELLGNRIDISAFVELTLNNFSLQDFINVIIIFLPSNISIYSLLDKRITIEQSPLFATLLEPLRRELKSFHALDINLMILSKVSPCLTAEQSPQLIPVINLILDTVENEKKYSVSNEVQALCFMASSIERFNLTLFESFPRVINFAVGLYTDLISNEVAGFITEATASICLLLKTSANLCMPKLPNLWKLMVSPIVIDQDPTLYNMVNDSMLMTTQMVQMSSDLMKAFSVAYLENRDYHSSVILIFNALSNNLKKSESYSINANLEQIFKFFIISFANKFNSNSNVEDNYEIMKSRFEENLTVQDAIIESFCILLTRLDPIHLRVAIRKVIDFFNVCMKVNNEGIKDDNNLECISYRFMFTRIMLKVTSGLESALEQIYEELLKIDIDQLLMAYDTELIDDGDFLKRQLTIEALSLFVNIKKFAPNADKLFNADYFNQCLNAILLHVTPIKETNTQEYVEKIVGGLAPSFAALIDSTRDDQLWRVASQKIIELTKSNDYRVRVAALQMADKAFETVGPELTSILPEIAPSIYELTEDTNNGVDQVARQTIVNIQESVGDSFNNYFS